MLVDTDVVSSKQSQAITREATYTVALNNGEPPGATLDLVYTNGARAEQRPDVNFVPEYRTFLRVLVPPGAQLVSSSGFDNGVSVGDECSRRVFAGQVSIADLGSTHVTLHYQLPSTITAANYDLLVQQQPGVPPGHLAVAVLGADSVAAKADLPNAGGRIGHWRLDTADATSLTMAPVPEAAPGGCGMSLVEARPTFPPVSVSVPGAGIDAPVVELGVSADGQMDAPPTPDVIGWYGMSSRPGEPGNVVMSGHVDWGHNPAVFWGLRKLQKGDVIQVNGADGAAHHYAVEWNRTYAWQTAPVDQIVGPSADSLLTLITCDGVFDQRLREYSERRVVRARLLD
jgi:LPXTG-site transpeptidase (sortase) family protein